MPELPRTAATLALQLEARGAIRSANVAVPYLCFSSVNRRHSATWTVLSSPRPGMQRYTFMKREAERYIRMQSQVP